MTDVTLALRASLAATLRATILRDGPMRLDVWMAACNAAYYAGHDPFGAAGDFVTAPEISQMFGEIIGGWIGDLWLRAGSPRARLVELGPGRGTLMADALRVAARLPGFAENVAVSLVETSPALRSAQTRTLRAVQATGVSADWHDRLDSLPDDLPVIIVANEFFDALPIRQLLGDGNERAVGVTTLSFQAATLQVQGTHDKGGADAGRAGEIGEAGAAIAAQIGARLRAHGGAALIIDYGYGEAGAGDSLQAMRWHAAADPFDSPGVTDLTAHVDFSALAQAAGDVRVSGPLPQGVWLARLGIEARAAGLKTRATPAQAAGIEAALVRLTAPRQMGALFKAMAVSAHGWPVPAGFDA